MRLLLVEDDELIGEGLQKALRQGGFSVNWARDGETAAATLRDESYELVILDLGLPDRPGLDVLGELRQQGNATPVLILTARDAVADRVAGLDAGADDYLLKPFALEELEARIRMLLRRQSGQAGEGVWLRHGALALNQRTHEVLYNGQKVALSGREFALMYAFIKAPGAVLSKAQLEDSVYGWNEEVASNAIEVHIHQLRKKLGSDIIRNIRNVGYCLAEEA
jgi:two-component system, OmpR family, response regulator QseB